MWKSYARLGETFCEETYKSQSSELTHCYNTPLKQTCLFHPNHVEMRANIAAKLLNPVRKGAIKPGGKAGLKILTRHAIEKIRRRRMVRGVAMLSLRATSAA
jgi:hypothetical protein